MAITNEKARKSKWNLKIEKIVYKQLNLKLK